MTSSSAPPALARAGGVVWERNCLGQYGTAKVSHTKQSLHLSVCAALGIKLEQAGQGLCH